MTGVSVRMIGALGAAKRAFWGNNAISIATYLHGIAICIATELAAHGLFSPSGTYCGIVGSVARVLLSRSSMNVSGSPHDLDLVIILDKVTPQAYRLVREVVGDVCKAFSMERVHFVPNYKQSPAWPEDISARDFPVQVLLHDLSSVCRRWEPFVYADRRKSHIDLKNSFPDFGELERFTTEQVVSMDDGIIFCKKAIGRNRVGGYEWKIRADEVGIEDKEVELKQDHQLQAFLAYSVRWAMINLARAVDSTFTDTEVRNLDSMFEALPASVRKAISIKKIRCVLNSSEQLSSERLQSCKDEVLRLLDLLLQHSGVQEHKMATAAAH